MKHCFLVLIAALCSNVALAQNANSKPKILAPPPVTKQIEIQKPQAPQQSTINTNLLDAAETPNRKKEPSVVYGGLFADFARSTNRWKMFSLRKPVDPAHDGDNLMDGHSGVGPSLKLFSIGFKK